MNIKPIKLFHILLFNLLISNYTSAGTKMDMVVINGSNKSINKIAIRASTNKSKMKTREDQETILSSQTEQEKYKKKFNREYISYTAKKAIKKANMRFRYRENISKDSKKVNCNSFDLNMSKYAFAEYKASGENEDITCTRNYLYTSSSKSTINNIVVRARNSRENGSINLAIIERNIYKSADKLSDDITIKKGSSNTLIKEIQPGSHYYIKATLQNDSSSDKEKYDYCGVAIDIRNNNFAFIDINIVNSNQLRCAISKKVIGFQSEFIL